MEVPRHVALSQPHSRSRSHSFCSLRRSCTTTPVSPPARRSSLSSHCSALHLPVSRFSRSRITQALVCLLDKTTTSLVLDTRVLPFSTRFGTLEESSENTRREPSTWSNVGASRCCQCQFPLEVSLSLISRSHSLYGPELTGEFFENRALDDLLFKGETRALPVLGKTFKKAMPWDDIS